MEEKTLTVFNEGDLVEYRFNKSQGRGIVIGVSGRYLTVKWQTGGKNGTINNCSPQALDILSKGTGKELKVEESKISMGGSVFDGKIDNNNNKGRLDSIYGKEKKPISENGKDVLKWISLIVFAAFAIYFIIFSILSYAKDSNELDKARMRTIEECIKITKKPIECKEALK